MNIRFAELNDLVTLMKITQRRVDHLNKQNIYQWDEIHPSRKGFQYKKILRQPESRERSEQLVQSFHYLWAIKNETKLIYFKTTLEP